MKKKKYFSRLTLIAFVLLIIFGFYVNLKEDDTETTPEVPTVHEIKNDDGLDAIKSEEQFKKETELRARKIKATREKEAETKRHDLAINKIESELEAIRKEEITLSSSFQLPPKQ